MTHFLLSLLASFMGHHSDSQHNTPITVSANQTLCATAAPSPSQNNVR